MEQRKSKARTWSACAKPYRLTMSPVILLQRSIVQRAGGGSAMRTPRMRCGIRACCLQEMRAARLRKY